MGELKHTVRALAGVETRDPKFFYDEFETDCDLIRFKGALLRGAVDTCSPIVCTVVDSNGAPDHAIVIFNDLVYDSREAHAAPLTQAALDRAAGGVCVRLADAFAVKAIGGKRRKRKRASAARSDS